MKGDLWYCSPGIRLGPVEWIHSNLYAGLDVCPGAVWDGKNLGGIVNTEEDQIIILKEFRWLCWFGVIDIKCHLIVLSAESCKVVSMETSNKNFQCEIGAHQLSRTGGRDMDALTAQKIPGSKHWYRAWIPKENKMRNSGKCDVIIVQIIIQGVNTRAFGVVYWHFA